MKRDDGMRGADGGFTLVELVVALGLLTFVMAGFYLMFFAFGKAAGNSEQLSQSQSLTRLAVRQLESDIRGADPLLQWPASGVPGSIAGSGTANTDMIAMYLPVDPLTPCARPTTTTTSPLPSPFSSTFTGTFTANVVWVYNPTTHILARYSTSANCSGALTWQTGQEVALYNVKNASGTMFTITSAGTQATISGATADQAAATSASAITVSILTQPKGQTLPFKISVTLPLPNQLALKGFACS